jgi:hypothetical protein
MRTRLILWTIGLTVALAAATPLTRGLVFWRERARVVNGLASADPAERKRAAWVVADEKQAALAYAVARRLEREADADVRESLVYALGMCRRAEHFAPVQNLATGDPSGYVRAAAWLAMARIDPGRTVSMAREAVLRADEWDRLGAAQALLEAGRQDAVDELLRIAALGEEGQRLVACRALMRGVSPLLEACGRLPLETPLLTNSPWPPDFVGEYGSRCRALNLQSIAEDTRLRLIASAPERREILRITNARNRIAAFLLSR